MNARKQVVAAFAPRTLTSHTVQAGFSAIMMIGFEAPNHLIWSTPRQSGITSCSFLISFSRHNPRASINLQDRVRGLNEPSHTISVSPDLLIDAITNANYPSNHLTEPDPGL